MHDPDAGGIDRPGLEGHQYSSAMGRRHSPYTYRQPGWKVAGVQRAWDARDPASDNAVISGGADGALRSCPLDVAKPARVYHVHAASVERLAFAVDLSLMGWDSRGHVRWRDPTSGSERSPGRHTMAGSAPDEV